MSIDSEYGKLQIHRAYLQLGKYQTANSVPLTDKFIYIYTTAPLTIIRHARRRKINLPILTLVYTLNGEDDNLRRNLSVSAKL